MLVVQAPGFVDAHAGAVQVRAGDTAQIDVELDVTPNFMERVQVTATKTPLSIGDVPAQTDIISRATIESRGDLTLTQAISHVPGAVVSTQLGIFESVMLRGMPSGDPEFTNTLLLIDGVPQATSRNGSRVIGLTINDASNIEVVRGPKLGALRADGHRRIGQRPDGRLRRRQPEFNVDFTGGQRERPRALARVSGPLSKWGGYYASIGKERNTGYFNTKTGGDYSDGNTAVFGKFTFSPNAKSFGSVSFNHVDSDNSTPTNEPIIGRPAAAHLRSAVRSAHQLQYSGPQLPPGREPVHVQLHLAADTDQRASSKCSAIATSSSSSSTTATSSARRSTRSRNTVDDVPVRSGPEGEDRLPGAARRVHAEDRQRQELARSSAASYEHTGGTLASDFLFTDEENEGIPINYLNPVIPPESEWMHDPQPLRTYHLGVTGPVRAVHDRTASALGVHRRRPLRSHVARQPARHRTPWPRTRSARSARRSSATYRLLGAEAAGRPSVNVYGAYSQAFLPPRAASSLTPANVEVKLQPEDIANSEIGLKGNAANGRVSFEATYFHMTENGVVLSQRQGPFFFPTNAGELRYDGVETGLSVDITPKVSAFVNASFYHSRFGEFVIESEDGDQVLTGNGLPIAPDYVVNWGASFRPTPSVDATVNIKSTSAMEANRENTFKIDPYTLVDAAVTWRHGPLRATLAARNLFNEEYYWNADGETADPGRPRQILFTISVGLK